jgi:hypothetical protein
MHVFRQSTDGPIEGLGNEESKIKNKIKTSWFFNDRGQRKKKTHDMPFFFEVYGGSISSVNVNIINY